MLSLATISRMSTMLNILALLERNYRETLKILLIGQWKIHALLWWSKVLAASVTQRQGTNEVSNLLVQINGFHFTVCLCLIRYQLKKKKKKRYQLIQVVHNALKAKDVVARSILITHQCFSRRKVLVIIPEKAMEILCFSSYINLALEWKSKCYLLSRVWLFVTPWTVASQVPLSTGFSWQEHWSGLPFPSPRDLLSPVMETTSPVSPSLEVNSLPLSHWGGQW